LAGFVEERLDLSQRIGILAASTSVGPSFSRGLLPRATVDQAVITGVTVGVHYALTALAESIIESVALKVTRAPPSTSKAVMAHRGTLLAGNLAAAGTGILAQRLLARREDEAIERAWVREASWRLAAGGLAGAVVLGSDMLLGRADASGTRPWVRKVPVALPIGTALAIGQYHRLRRRMAAEESATDAEGAVIEGSPQVAAGRSLLIGAGVSTSLFAFAEGERLFADGVAVLVRKSAPNAALLGKPIGHLAALGVLAAGNYVALQKVFHIAEHRGDAVEAAFASAPLSEFVSGGPKSAVSYDDIGRYGRRFVNMALTRDEIESVMGKPALEPIRVFVGLESAATTSARAELALRELEALGAFERKLIVFCSPTGTGYLNYVTTEALEYLTRGDVAIVAMQYSLRPSPLSLNRVGIGIEQNTAFLDALKRRLSAILETRRPRLVIFGESLGAQTSEDVFKDEGTRGFHRIGIERGLFLGTPAATKWRQRWLADPASVDPDGEVVEVDGYEEFAALPELARRNARYMLLTHHNDPMPKFWFPIAVRQPDWLGPPETREPGVPREVAWRPYTTFVITLADVKNALHVIPGKFVAWGHDYRRDLARFVSLAYDLPTDAERLERIERALRRRELVWAERRLSTQQLSDAEDKVKKQLAAWGVQKEYLPLSFAAPGPQEADPFDAHVVAD